MIPAYALLSTLQRSHQANGRALSGSGAPSEAEQSRRSCGIQHPGTGADTHSLVRGPVDQQRGPYVEREPILGSSSGAPVPFEAEGLAHGSAGG